MTELHERYAPILRYNRDEQFFPMRVDGLLGYSALYVKGQREPVVPVGQVTVEDLVRHSRSSEVFLRSVEVGPLFGQDVVAAWGAGALEMVYRSVTTPATLAEHLARQAYAWFNPRTSEATKLFWWNDLVVHLLQGTLHQGSQNELPRLILPSETQQSAVERYRAHVPSPAYTYYYRQVRDGRYLCLQYWFFYAYNDWGRRFGGMNDHEGDWECMMLFFRLDDQGRSQEPPAYITFADHESRQTKPWDHEDVTRVGTHPVVFAAAGSHASYPEAKTQSLMEMYRLFDYATGDGVTIDHDDWVHRIDLDTMGWLGDYAGSWGTRFWLPTNEARAMLSAVLAAVALPLGLTGLLGPSEIELPGVSAPHGPVGAHRPQYATPVAWAGVPAE